MKNKNLKLFLIICSSFFIIYTNSKIYANQLRIISLAPNLTNILLTLNKNSKTKTNIVGAIFYKQNQYKNIENIGSLNSINFLKILKLKPDVIFTWKNINSFDTILKLKKLKLNVHIFELENNNILNFTKLTSKVAQITKQEKATKDINNKFNLEIKKLQKKINNLKSAMFILNHNPIYTVGNSSYLNQILNICGFKNPFQKINKQAFIISNSTLLIKNPKFIFDITENNTLINKKEITPFWNQFSYLKAVKNKKVFQINPKFLSQIDFDILQGIKLICKIGAENGI